MPTLSPLVLRSALFVTLAAASGALVVGCSPPSNKSAKPQQSAPKKDLPKDPWLDGVLAMAEVSVVGDDGKTVRCRWNEGKKRHLCPEHKSWVYVGPQVLKVGDRDEYCVWQHPADNATVRTKLKGLATTPLELKHAFAGAAAGVKEAAPVDVVLKVDGQERAKAQRARRPGFESVRIESAKEGGAGDLEILVSTSHTGVGHFCWQLKRLGDVKPTVPAPGGAAAAEGATATPDVKAAAATTADAEKAKAGDGDKPALAAEKPAEAAAATATKAPAPSNPGVEKQLKRLNLPKGAQLKQIAPVKPLKKVE